MFQVDKELALASEYSVNQIHKRRNDEPNQYYIKIILPPVTNTVLFDLLLPYHFTCDLSVVLLVQDNRYSGSGSGRKEGCGDDI